MALTTTIHSALQALTFRSHRTPFHPDAVSEARLDLPRRIDDPASASRLARDLLRGRREDLSLALYLDDRHRLVGHAIVAVGWVQEARLSALPIRFGSQLCRASAVILVRYRPSGARSATEAEQRSYRALAAGCSRHGLAVIDHLVVGFGGFNSAWRRS